MAFGIGPTRRSAADAARAARSLWPGVLSCALMAWAALFVSQHSGAPAFLVALLFGMAMAFLNEDDNPSGPGLAFCARTILRVSVALLGFRVSFETLVALGWSAVALVAICSLMTVLVAVLLSARLGRDWQFGVLIGGAVAICGASAAAAIAAVLPQNRQAAVDLGATVISVTVLSTVAMVFYPVIVGVWGLDDQGAGIFLGATIHDVAQVLGAGFSISEPVGEQATVIKLVRVDFLGPVVVCVALIVRARRLAGPGEPLPPLLPAFVIAFFGLATLNSLGLFGEAIVGLANDVSVFGLLVAIAAIGTRTSLRDTRKVGRQAILQIGILTLVLAAFVAIGLAMLPVG